MLTVMAERLPLKSPLATRQFEYCYFLFALAFRAFITINIVQNRLMDTAPSAIHTAVIRYPPRILW